MKTAEVSIKIGKSKIYFFFDILKVFFLMFVCFFIFLKNGFCGSFVLSFFISIGLIIFIIMMNAKYYIIDYIGISSWRFKDKILDIKWDVVNKIELKNSHDRVVLFDINNNILLKLSSNYQITEKELREYSKKDIVVENIIL